MIFVLSLLFPVFAILGSVFGGYSTYLATLLFVPIISIVDCICDFLKIQYPFKKFSRSRNVAKLVTIAWAVLFPIAVWKGAKFVSQNGTFSASNVGMTLSVGLTGSVAIIAAHELIHKAGKMYKCLGYLMLMNVFYMHFGILHLVGHHRNVGTLKDHSTAWFGESVYQYLFRTIKNCFVETWNIEVKRLSSENRRSLSMGNRMLWFIILPVIQAVIFTFMFGFASTVFFVGQSFVAIIMLETVSYIQHYGLVRARSKSGTLEPLQAKHSWDSYKVFSNIMFMNIQVHSHHHRQPSSWFSALDLSEGALELPYGYPLMIQISFIPFLWRRVVHPILARNEVSRY